MTDDVRILLAQHAKTTRLLGVDFLPLGPVPALVGTGAQIEAKPDGAVAIVAEPDVGREVRTVRRPESPPRPGSGRAVPVPIEDLRASYDHLQSPADRLDALRQRYEHDAPHRHFNTEFTNIVFGEGSPTADLMFVGEAPGEQEDLSGRPFVGRAGQLLEKMIVAMGLSRESVYICNVLKTRPPNNATPTQHEAGLCAPYLLEQIRIISPKVIVTLGLPASHLLLGTTSPMRSMRGHWHRFPPAEGVFCGGDPADFPQVEVMPTYHPAYLLRSYTEENRRKVWSDLQQVITRLG